MNASVLLRFCIFTIVALVAGREALGATVYRIPPNEFELFNCDVNGDGIPDIGPRFSTSTLLNEITPDRIQMAFNANAISPGADYPIFPGGRTQYWASLLDGNTASELLESPYFAGAYTAPSSLSSQILPGAFYSTVEPPPLLVAGYLRGTGASLIGFILDTTAYYSSGGIADLTLYVHSYGSIPRLTTVTVSLADTGFVPEASRLTLLGVAACLAMLRRKRAMPPLLHDSVPRLRTSNRRPSCFCWRQKFGEAISRPTWCADGSPGISVIPRVGRREHRRPAATPPGPRATGPGRRDRLVHRACRRGWCHRRR